MMVHHRIHFCHVPNAYNQAKFNHAYDQVTEPWISITHRTYTWMCTLHAKEWTTYCNFYAVCCPITPSPSHPNQIPCHTHFRSRALPVRHYCEWGNNTFKTFDTLSRDKPTEKCVTTLKIKFCVTQQKEWNCASGGGGGSGNGFGGNRGGGNGGGYVYRSNSVRHSGEDEKGACRFVWWRTNSIKDEA